MAEEETLESLRERLQTYSEQLRQAEEALRLDPSNEELVKLFSDLNDIVALTTELVQEAEQNEQAGAASGAASSEDEAPPPPPPPKPQVLAVGADCEALYNADGLWYDAKITAINIVPGGDKVYTVVFTGYDETAEVGEGKVRWKGAGGSDGGGGGGGGGGGDDDDKASAGQKRKKPEKSTRIRPIPKSLTINPDDPEEVKQMKKKKIHAIKSANRLKQMEEERNEKQQAWKSFLGGKGTKKKTGFFTGRQKESIFKSPESLSGKVGVTGSGQEMTPNLEKRIKFTKTGTVQLK